MSTVDAYKNAITVLDPAPDSPERTGRALSLIVNGVEFEMTPRASRLSMQELPNGDYVLRLHRSETPALLMSISTNLLDFALTLDQDKTLVSGVMDLSSVFQEASSLSKQQPHHKSSSTRRIQRFHVAVPIASDEAVERAIRLHRPLARLKIHGYREVPGPLVVEEAELVLTPVTADILYARTAFLGSELLDGAVPEHTLPNIQQEPAMIGLSLAPGTKLTTDFATVAGGPCVYLMGRKLACSPSAAQSCEFQSLGPASQTVFAIAFMQFLQAEHGRLASSLHDRTLVVRLLKNAGSLDVLRGLEVLYGGPEQLPTLHQLLHHTSGLPQTFDMTSGDLDAVLAASPKAENARIVNGHDSVQECFGRLLEERCSLVHHNHGKQRHESPLNYAILKFMLPNHSVGWAMGKLFESSPQSIRQHHRCDDASVYGGYNGISLTLDSLGWLLGDPAWVPQQWRDGSVHTELLESATQLYADAWHVPGATAVMGAGNLLLLDTPHAPILSGVVVGVHGAHICLGVVLPTIGLSAAQFFNTEPSSVPSPGLVRRLTLELINRVLSGLKLDLSTLNKPDLLGAMGVPVSVSVPVPVSATELGEGVELPRQFVDQKMIPLLVKEYPANALAIQISQSSSSSSSGGNENPQLSFVGVVDYTMSLPIVMDEDGRTLRLVDPLSKLPAERLGLVRIYSDRAAHLSEHLIQLCGKLYGSHDLAHDVLGLLVRGSARSKELYDRQLTAKTRALEHKQMYRQMIKPLAIPKSERAEPNPEPEPASSSGEEEQEDDEEQEEEYESASPEILKQVFDLMLARQRALVDPDVGSALYSGPLARDADECGLWAAVPERSVHYAQCMAHPVDTPMIPSEPLLSLVAFKI